MLELHFIRTMLDILDFTIVFQGKKDENLYTKEFIKKPGIVSCLTSWCNSKDSFKMVPTLVVREPLFSKRGLCVSNNLQQSHI